MQIVMTDDGPTHEAIHVDLAGQGTDGSAGVLLTLTDPSQILRAAKRAARHDVDWVVWRLGSMPCAEARAAAFVVTLARQVRGRVFVVLRSERGRQARIAGHIRRATLSVGS